MSGVIYARAFCQLLIARLTSDKPIQYFLQKIGWLNRFESLDAESRDGGKVKDMDEVELHEVTTLENEYAENIVEIGCLEQRNDNIIQDLIKLCHGVSVGDIVVHKGNEYLVTKLETLGEWGKGDRTRNPWAHGKSKVKDGGWGKQEHCLYGEWERKA